MRHRNQSRLKRAAVAFLVLVACLCSLVIVLFVVTYHSAGIRVQGTGVRPQIGFACCDKSIPEMQALFADPSVVADLRELHAQVAVAISDFSPQRAQTVRLLNQQGIPAIAWMLMPADQGYYFNANNAAEAPARLAAFEKWTSENGLRWAAIGLDIEPGFSELAALSHHRSQLVQTLVGRSFDGNRIARARAAYATLIRETQALGLPVQTYAMPYLPLERGIHSNLLDRLLGTVDVRGNDEYVMIYASFARPRGEAMIWTLGPHAQSISLGVTDGPMPAGSGFGPLTWDEFSSDLIVATHFTTHIGVYNLEGSVRQGFLPRLKSMNWSSTAVIPAAALSQADRLHLVVSEVLLIAANLVYFIAAALLLIAWLIWRRSAKKRQSTIPE
jgi:hypothetical protein